MQKLRILISGIELEGLWSNIALMISRVTTGLTMAFAHGLAKVPPADGFIGGVSEMGFPLPGLFAWVAGLSEFLGGILLALGFLTRPAALAIGFTMVVAAFIAHAGDPFSKMEMALLYLTLCVLFLGLGGGRFSVDGWLARR